MKPILEICEVSRTYKRGRKERVEALKEVAFAVPSGQTLGIVGESGCGKSTLCRILTGLEAPSAGQVYFHGRPLYTGLAGRWRKPVHEGKIQMVFQNSLEAVNLYADVYHILAEPLVNFFHMSPAECQREAARLLELVGLSESDMKKYPAQFSGGQLQRICIARALAARPEVLLLDEPLSSLDVSVQAQILNLLADLKQSLGLTCVLISHDLEAVYYLSDGLLVMHDGCVVERLEDIGKFDTLSHPCTRRLLKACRRIL